MCGGVEGFYAAFRRCLGFDEGRVDQWRGKSGGTAVEAFRRQRAAS